MKAVRVTVSGELLMQALHLPEGSIFRGASTTEDGRDAVLIVEHASLADVDEPADARPNFKRQDPVVFVDWGLL